MFDIKKMIKLYQETFQQNQISAEFSGLTFENPNFPNQIGTEIRADIAQAVKLGAAFFSAVIKQDSLERPFIDSYDEFTGQIRQLGIYPDKWFAQMFLMGDDAFPLNPNFGSIPVSFVNIRDDATIGPVIDNILEDTFINSGDAYNGFDEVGRFFYSLNARRFFDFGGDQLAIDLMKVECYAASRFESRFGIPPPGPGPSSVLTPNFAAATTADDYFNVDTSIDAININGEVYVASPARNKYSSGLIKNNDLNGILNSRIFYQSATDGVIVSCR